MARKKVAGCEVPAPTSTSYGCSSAQPCASQYDCRVRIRRETVNIALFNHNSPFCKKSVKMAYPSDLSIYENFFWAQYLMISARKMPGRLALCSTLTTH